MSKKYELTPEHRAELKPWADKWIDNALSTRRVGGDWEKVVGHVQGLYKSADLEPPPAHRVVRVDSPIIGAKVATSAAVVWWLRENEDHHVKLFGRVLTERDYAVAVAMHVYGTHAATRAATEDATEDATEAATYATEPEYRLLQVRT